MTFALRLLARRSRSEAEIEQALERRGASAVERRQVLERLRELRYVDDRRFAVDRTEKLASRGYGSPRIRVDLEQSGISEEVVTKCLAALRTDPERAGIALQRRFGSSRPADRGRAWRYLTARGFSEDVIRDILGDETER